MVRHRIKNTTNHLYQNYPGYDSCLPQTIHLGNLYTKNGAIFQWKKIIIKTVKS